MKSRARRRTTDLLMAWLTYGAAAVATLPLLFILAHLLIKGAASLDLNLFLHMPRPVGVPGGGMSNAIVGTFILISIAALVGIPIGIGAGLYLAERSGAPIATAVRFLADVMNGLPSIVVGIFAWQFLVRPVGHFSALAGGLALALMVIPTVTRTTEEMIRLVPSALREGALALGATRWRAELRVVVPAAFAGIVTGALLAIARVAGETAPLLFTAFGNQFWSWKLGEPIAAIPLQVFNYAISPYEEWHQQAWAGAFVLIVAIVLISIVARRVTRQKFG